MRTESGMLYKLVLIVPLWNWNMVLRLQPLVARLVLIVPLWNWNTIDVDRIIRDETGSNRTFMELKLVERVEKPWWQGVLIVPLWNWNSGQETLLCVLQQVLIVPLWNWNNPIHKDICNLLGSSNRTFMELKLAISLPLSALMASVLIVPLWNWNTQLIWMLAFAGLVLIVPLWNWNWLGRGGSSSCR